MTRRTEIPRKTQKLIWQEAESMCGFCQNDEVDVLEIHHIIEWSKSKDHSPENLILVCSNCHSKITNGSITQVEVLKTKINVRNKIIKQSVKSNVLDFPRKSNLINLERVNNSGIIANNYQIKTQTKSVRLEPPNGTIASDRDKRSYVKRLIERYQDFKKSEHGLVDFKYQVIYSSIKNEFKCKWDFIRLEIFLHWFYFYKNELIILL